MNFQCYTFQQTYEKFDWEVRRVVCIEFGIKLVLESKGVMSCLHEQTRKKHIEPRYWPCLGSLTFFIFFINLYLLHIVKDVVVVKLFPSIHPSRHPSSLVEGILWLPILLLLQQPPIFLFLHLLQLNLFQVQQVQKLPFLHHHLLLQSHHLWALGILVPLEILVDLELRKLQMHLL